MLIQQLNRTDAERVQLVFKNVDGSGSITTGKGVCMVTLAASFDGVSAVKNAAALALTFAGVAAQDVPINGFGLATAWGYAGSVEISGVGSSVTVTAGDVLKPSAVAGAFISVLAAEAISTLLYKYVVNGTTITISTGSTYIAGFVRAL